MGRTFKASTPEKKPDFTISGGDDEGYTPFEEHFVCRGTIPAGMLLRFAEVSTAAQTGDTLTPEQVLESGTTLLSLVKDFFDAALTPADRIRFHNLINDPDRPVEFQMLMEIMNYLAEEFTTRPTGGPSPTSSPGMPSGPDSTAGASPGASTFSRLPRTPAVALA